MKIMLYTSKDAASHKKLGEALRELPEGEYVITVKKNRAIRSLSANRYYHCILNIIGIHTGHTHEELHEAMKMKFNCAVIYFPKGGSQIVGKTTSDLDSAEFSSYIARVKQWALDEFNLVIPEAKDIDYKRWMEIENNYDETVAG